MNDFEKQVLKNQRALLSKAMREELNEIHKMNLLDLEHETFKLLNPEHVQTLAEKTHDALCEENEVKKE